MDTLMYCKTCGREETAPFGACLFGARPWPRCHGRQMAFRQQPSPAEIEQAVAAGLAPLLPVLQQIRQTGGAT